MAEPVIEGNGVRAVDRTVDLLEALASSPSDGAGLTVLARRVGMPKSTTLRYLATLEARGFVERVGETGAYRLGVSASPRAATSALAAVLARPILLQLRDRCRETVSLGMLDGTMVTFVETFESPETIRVAGVDGDRNWLHTSAAGKAILAALDPAVAIRLVTRAGMPQMTVHSIGSPARLLSELEMSRKRGYTTSIEENDLGARSVGVPVRWAGASVGLSVSAPLSRLPDEQIESLANVLQEVAGRLERLNPGASDAPARESLPAA